MAEGSIVVEKVHIDNLADIATKTVTGIKFQHCCDLINIVKLIRKESENALLEVLSCWCLFWSLLKATVEICGLSLKTQGLSPIFSYCISCEIKADCV